MAVFDLSEGDATGTEKDDTYVYARSDGVRTITEQASDGSGADGDTLEFEEGIEVGDIVLALSGDNDENMEIRFRQEGNGGALDDSAKITIINWASAGNRIETLRFADGTELDIGKIADGAYDLNEGGPLYGSLDGSFLSGGIGNDELLSVGTNANSILIGGKGNDTLRGSRGDEVYVFGRGDGHDTIIETFGPEANPAAGGNDTLVLRGGIGIEDLVLNLENDDNDLVIRLKPEIEGGDVEDMITIKGWSTAVWRIETLQFSDGETEALDLSTLDLAKMEGAEKKDFLTPREQTGWSWLNGGASTDTLKGGDGKDILHGRDGNDWLYGEGGDDKLYGGDGADVLFGGNNNDKLHGGDDNDTLIGEGGDDELEGGAGDDNLYGGDDNDALDGGDDDDDLFGGDGNDILYGGSGDDELEGGDGNDVYVFDRGDGRDVILDDGSEPAEPQPVGPQTEPGAKASVTSDRAGDKIRLGEGITLQDIVLRRDGDDLKIHLLDDEAPGTPLDNVADRITVENWNQADNRVEILELDDGTRVELPAFSNIHLGTTSPVDDEFTGSSEADWMDGGGGDDTLNGEGGKDVLRGGTGDDTLDGGIGGDILIGGADSDILIGGADSDTLEGGDGNDVYVFNRGDGRDVIRDTGSVPVEAGTPLAAGSSAAGDPAGDKILLGAGITLGDIALRRDGDDLKIHILGDETPGTPLDDVGDAITVENWNLADRRIEVLELADGTRIHLPSFPNIHLDVASSRSNPFRGSSEADWIGGGGGDDTLNGLAGDDVLLGGDGDDTLNGGNDADFLSGGRDADTLNGGLGNDRYFFRRGDGKDTINESGDGDSGQVGGGDDTLVLGDGIGIDDLNLDLEGDDMVIALKPETEGAMVEDSVTIKNWGASTSRVETLLLSDGTVVDLGGLDFAKSGISEDELQLAPDGKASWLAGDAGENDLYGSTGNDILLGGAGADTLEGRIGDDVLYGGKGGDTLHGEEDNDTLYGGAGVDTLDGGSGDDVLYGGADRDTLHGRADNDELHGGAGNDTLDGDAGNDVLYGGTGRDILRGGHDNDVYVFNRGDGRDTILDSGSMPVASQASSGADASVVSDSAGDKIVLGEGITLEDVVLELEDSDFKIHILDDETPGTPLDDVTDRITIKNWNLDGSRIEILEFADGRKIELPAFSNIHLDVESSGRYPFAGSSEADWVDGGAGDDWLSGGGSGDIVHGGAGNDRLYGGTGDDVMYGGADNDWLSGGGNDDILYGGRGRDQLFGGNDDDILYGEGGGDDLSGGRGNDVLNGGLGGDRYIFQRGFGHDVIDERTIVNGPGGREQVDGGNDKLWFGAGIGIDDLILDLNEHGDLVISLKPETDGGEIKDRVTIRDWGQSKSRVETLWLPDGPNADLGALSFAKTGTSADEELSAVDDKASWLSGGAGDDDLRGGRNHDFLFGGNDNDTLHGGHGNDVYVFNRGDGQDVINDTGSAPIVTETSPKVQTPIATDPAGDKILLGAGITVGDIMLRREGNDLKIYILDDEVPGVALGDVGDVITVENWNLTDRRVEILELADGTRIELPSFSNIRVGAAPSIDDPFTGSSETDWMDGDAGDNTLNGDDGDDILFGRDGDDSLDGGADADWLYGGDGNDTLDGGAGDDRLYGGDDNDVYVFDRGDGQDVISDSGSVSIEVETPSGSDAPITSDPVGDKILFGEGITLDEIVLRREGNDLKLYIRDSEAQGIPVRDLSDAITVKNWNLTDRRIEILELADGTRIELPTFSNIFVGRAIDNHYTKWFESEPVWFDGAAGDDNLTGGGGNDVLLGRSGSDRLFGGGGKDKLFGGNDMDFLHGSQGDDMLYGGDGNDRLSGGDDQDTLYGGANHDFLDGGKGDDILYGGSGNDALYGGWYHGSDTLYGGSGDDLLNGRDGNDVIRGGADNDTCIAGAGIDTYHFGFGDGQDVYKGSAEDGIRGTDLFVFDDDVTVEDIWLERVGDNLRVRLLGTEDRIDFEGWFDSSGPGKHIDGFRVGGEFLGHAQVQSLLDAMDDLTPSIRESDNGVTADALPDSVTAAIDAAWETVG